MKKLIFPKGFVWGSATAAYQVEGGYDADGKGKSIWDVFANTSGKILDGKTGNVACDSYHRWKDDVEALASMKQNGYRYSIAWSRVMPEGTGKISEKGLDYYKRLTDALLEKGIQPCVTLYHWDLPQALHEKGGWPNRDCALWFGEYARAMFETFKDRPIMWSTINEPIETALAYTVDFFAPGGTKDEKIFKQCQHNILLAHGEGVKAFRDVAPKNGKIGIVVDCWRYHPVRPTAEDIAKAKREEENTFRLYLNAIFKGRYSQYLLDQMNREGTTPDIREGDMEKIGAPIDFYGLNIYGRYLVSTSEAALTEARKSEPKWYAACVEEVCDILRDDIGVNVPVYITENGTLDVGCTRDEQNRWIDTEPRIYKDGKQQDDRRIAYMKDFLAQVHKQIGRGMDIRGYFHWSLMDNFEWASGYLAKMGLLEIDSTTYDRKRKKSADWYESVCRENGFTIDD